ncbi:MAG: hypothetical protein HDS68_02055 [Bacteroidales bacterium]|nr:hypothetical protein [Bacteroidales bacterium]
MKKLLSVILTVLCCLGASAQIVPSLDRLNIFNHLGVGVHAGTSGIGFEAGTTVTDFVELRAGFSIMPGFGFHTESEIEYDNYYSGDYGFNNEVTLDASFKRVQGSVIFNIYPGGKKFPLFIAAGAYFGGSDLVKIKGHVDPEMLDFRNNPYVQIGDYQIDFDDNGNIEGTIRVNKFRPYLGIGTGHFIPKRRVNFSWELGVQFHGKPSIYANGEKLMLSDISEDDSFQKIMDKITIWPVLKFTISGRIF